MDYSFSLKDCSSLTLITSETCNLKCSYCNMAKSALKYKITETENIKKALKDGTYLNNIKQIFYQHKIDSNNITSMELWGQEPTLTLKEFSESFKDFYSFLPNLEKLFFSTNGVGFSNSIIGLIQIIDNIIEKPFELGIQFSYDGQDATSRLRGVDPNIIISNIVSIIDQLNQIKLNNLTVVCNFHNVLSIDLINKFGNKNTNNIEFYNYLKELSDLGYRFSSLNNNEKVFINRQFNCGIETPYNATKKEGENLANFCRMADVIGNDIKIKWWRTIMSFYNEARIKMPEYFNNSLNFYANLKQLHPEQFISMGCHTCKNQLFIRYDGTILPCHEAISHLNSSNYPNNENLEFQLQKELNSKNYYPNLLDEKQKISIDKTLYRYQNFLQNYIFSNTEIITLFYLLMNAQQVDNSYLNDEEKIFRHAQLVSIAVSCPYQNLNTTGSIYGVSIGKLRLLCNGFLDVVDEYYYTNKVELEKMNEKK